MLEPRAQDCRSCTKESHNTKMLPFIVTNDLPLHIRFRFATGEREVSSLKTPQISEHGKTSITIPYTHTLISPSGMSCNHNHDTHGISSL